MTIVTKDENFLQALASGEPVPGGGAAAALCGALAAALCEMAANLTLGKKNSKEEAKELAAAAAEANRLRLKLERLIEADAAAFCRLSQIRKMPRTTEEETARRGALLEDALAGACEPPLGVMTAAAASVSLLEGLEKLALPGLKSDLGAGALFGRAALLGAALNVRANTKLFKDREKADFLNEKAEKLAVFAERAEALYQQALAFSIRETEAKLP
ncbi:MAG: cyclodeaminase/cyclohydrolase family protein [Acidaminococcales bacterium]|jgi:formiminotetrahydrofolate cyclodeaminase|nr:cyclodeaminase/cyclohydrolase family protein [Acidaminococcales bacterium]